MGAGSEVAKALERLPRPKGLEQGFACGRLGHMPSQSGNVDTDRGPRSSRGRGARDEQAMENKAESYG